MKKEKTITRRRKKQLKRTIAKPEGLIVYAMVAMLLFVQANHAITISSKQMGYSDLVSYGSFHDWEESLTWMDNNLESTAVVVSWWDYGYWISAIGNVTTVNDGATWNQTRIGLTGMAMMQTQERYSAEIFRRLQADYVLVYFGHLVQGIGGDEGKWPWMVRICNDNTEKYEKYDDLTKDNWYSGDVDTVFNEADYINETSGLYRESWFNSTLTKLMFHNELINPNAISSSDGYPAQMLATEIGGYPEGGKNPKEDDNGKLWKDYPSINGDYNLEFFDEAYISSNKLVKVFKIDYTPLDTSFSISNQHIDTDGYGNALITNTGLIDFSVSSLKVSGQVFNFTVEDSADLIKPGESRYVWFNTERSWDTNAIYNIEMEVSVSKGINIYKLSENTADTQVVIPDISKIEIDRENSLLELSGTQSNAKIVVKNLGNQPQKISKIFINDDEMELNQYLVNNLIIGPNETESFYFENTGTASTFDFTESNYIQVQTSEGNIAETVLGFNRENFKLTILPSDFDILPESRFLFDYSVYEDMTVPNNDYYLNYNTQSYLLEDGSLKLTVRNDGIETIGLQNLYANGVQINNFIVVGSGKPEELFLEPGTQRVILANVSNVERNSPVNIYVTGQNEGTCASDNGYFVPRNQTSMISIITSENSMTSAFTNETLRLVVKNVGYNEVELDSIVLNGTETIEIQDNDIAVGNKILYHDDIALIDVSFNDFKLNLTNTLNVVVNTTSSSFVFSEVNLTSRLPTADNITRIIDPDEIMPYGNHLVTYADVDEDLIHLMLSINHNSSATIDGIRLKIGTGKYEYLDMASSGIKILDDEDSQNTITDSIITGSESGNLALFYIDMDLLELAISLTAGDIIWVQVITAEGYEDTVEITVSA